MNAKNRRIGEFYGRMQGYGIEIDDADALRRIEMTLSRWDALECGDGNAYASWAIEHDETTDKPYMVYHYNDGTTRRQPIADREKGALKRLAVIMAKYPDLEGFHQSDPRGCSLYVVRKSDLMDRTTGKALELSSCYTRGVAVCY